MGELRGLVLTPDSLDRIPRRVKRGQSVVSGQCSVPGFDRGGLQKLKAGSLGRRGDTETGDKETGETRRRGDGAIAKRGC